MDTRAIGLGVLSLGGGRRHPGDAIDHRIVANRTPARAREMAQGDPLVTIHAADEDAWQRAAGQVREAIVIGDEAETLPAVHELIQ